MNCWKKQLVTFIEKDYFKSTNIYALSDIRSGMFSMFQ